MDCLVRRTYLNKCQCFTSIVLEGLWTVLPRRPTSTSTNTHRHTSKPTTFSSIVHLPWNTNFMVSHLQCSSGKRAWKRKLQSCKVLYSCESAYIFCHWLHSLLYFLIFKGKTCLYIYLK